MISHNGYPFKRCNVTDLMMEYLVKSNMKEFGIKDGISLAVNDRAIIYVKDI